MKIKKPSIGGSTLEYLLHHLPFPYFYCISAGYYRRKTWRRGYAIPGVVAVAYSFS